MSIPGKKGTLMLPKVTDILEKEGIKTRRHKAKGHNNNNNKMTTYLQELQIAIDPSVSEPRAIMPNISQVQRAIPQL
ncbi:uncharacterized protein FFB20_08456 [Fusarium fujikuroi]|nr:uncharacterized protein FFB20_08456 [Fusarium fujikuroi]